MFILLILPLAGSAQSQAPLTSIQQVHSLSNAEAAGKIPVKLQGTVTYARPSEKNLFIADGDSAIYVRFASDIGLLPGDRVEVDGATAPSFRPIIVADQVRFLAHGAMPPAQPANYTDLIQSKWDSRFVQVSGHVLSAAYDDSKPIKALRIRTRVPDGTVEGIVAHPGSLQPEALLDADVRLQGVAGGQFDSKMQMAGVWLDISSAQDVTILKPAVQSPWSLPAIPMDSVIGNYRFSNQSNRVKISGILTYFEPGSLAVIEQQGKSMLVETDSNLPLHAGAGVEATGFPEVTGESVRLQNAQLRESPQSAVVQPQKILWESASVGEHAYDLVSMDGEIVGAVHDSRVDMFIIQSGKQWFSASLRHSSSDAGMSGVGAWNPTIGTKVRVTGVCFVDSGNHWRDRLWFDLRMRSLNDIVVLQAPSWWNVRRLSYLATLLSAAILAAVIWVGFLDRRLRAQSAILARQSQEDAIRERRLARQEQQRSRILELISSAEPLNEVLGEIRAMVSTRLLGGACWFELNESTVGPAATELTEIQNINPEWRKDPGILMQELLSPDGTSFGYLLATPRLRNATKPEIQNEASEALAAGARLAELAIDTRRLYSDLRHRSEHDLLTDLPNRFSMERQLDRLIYEADRTGNSFGLIYVDLDRFKQINDRYGHRTGDLYLQEVTRRMKLQLRTNDVLARIGGDEFIALVPILRNRSDAQEIATRLERCFDEPFDLEGVRMRGSASVGLGVYPEDGLTKEQLQRAADEAMYNNKEQKREKQKLDEVMERVWSGDLLK